MLRAPTLRRVFAATLSFAAAPLALAAPADVWTVAPTGADFTQVQPAVDAAADGDLILVKPGSYAQFSIFDRTLTVVAQSPGTVFVSGAIRVANLAAGRQVNLIDLSAQGDEENALRLVDNLGAVRVRGGMWRGAAVTNSTQWRFAIYVVGSEDVALRDCQVFGGQATANQYGGWGLFSRNSSLALHGCMLKGANGASGFQGAGGAWGLPGGSGARVEGGFLYVTDSSLTGGNGGEGQDSNTFIEPGGPGGGGGHGLWVAGEGAQGTNANFATVELRQVSLVGGKGGSGGWPTFTEGPDGAPLFVQGQASVTTHAAPAFEFVSDGLWTTGQPETVTFQAQPGADVFLVAASTPQFKWLASKQGVLLVGGFPLLKYMGECDAGGTLTRTFVPPDLSASVEGRVLHWQAWSLSSGSTAGVLGPPLTTALIAPGF